MSDRLQERIDEFAQKLGALNVEFEALKRSVPAPEEPIAFESSPQPPAWIQEIDDLFAAGSDQEALRVVERIRARARGTGSAPMLAELLAYLDTVPPREGLASGRRLEQVRQLVQQSLTFAGGGSEPAAPRQEPVAVERVPYPRPAAPAPREPRKPRPAIELDLLGPRALAIAGGIVTLLGIVFFFVLAVNRGWIDPHRRVALGGIASALVFAAGLELKRRYGTTYSALAAVGAGLAGGYATLLSAAALYHLLPDWAALVAASGIAAVGLVTSVLWRSEIVAGIGLLGALLVPAVIEAQGGLSVLATSYVAIVFAVLAGICLWLGWRWLLVAGGIGSLPQILALAFSTQYLFRYQSPTGVLVLVAVFFVLYAASGCVRQLRVSSTSLDAIATAFVLGAGLMAGGSFARLLLTNEQRGVAFMILAGAYVVPGAFFFTRERTRDLGALLAFATFTLIAVGTALLLHGDGLAYAWAAEAAGLAWLARTVREIRFQLWSGVYLVLALIHSLFDAPPRHLDHPGLTPDAVTAHPASGVGTIVAVAAAAAVFSFFARPWSEDELPGGQRLLAEVYKGFAEAHRSLRLGTAWLALVLSTYAASLGVLAVFSSSGSYDDMVRGFVWGTVANACLWMAIGLVLLAFGFRRDLEHLRVGALVWLGLTGLLALAQASRFLVDNPRTVAVAVVGVAALVTSFAYGMSRREGVDRGIVISAPTALLSLALLVYPIAYRLDGHWEGAALLGLAAIYAILSAVLYRRPARDAGTVFWAIAIGVGAVGDAQLLHGTYQVLGWAAAGVAVAWLARRVPEPRLHLGAALLVALAVLQAFLIQAPLRHLFTTYLHPAYGAASIFIAALAVAGLAYFARAELGRLGVLRKALWWLAGGLTVYGVSLVVLEVVEWISNAPLHTDFQRGQTAVSAFWGLLGLALLYIGLKRRSRALRIAGLVCFPIILAKIFFYDLPALSSVTRALSFLAVGAVLLLGGFFYQRLMSDRDEPAPTPTTQR